MKKIISSILLMIALSFVNLTGGDNNKDSMKDSIEFASHVNYNLLIGDLTDLIANKDGIKYSNLNKIPIQSPININQLKALSSDYGLRRHPIFRRWMWHKGIDLSAKLNTPVYSTADGIIIKTRKSKYGYGNYVTIKHNKVYKTKYAHLKQMNVSVGDSVAAGQLIGTVGSTGLSTGPHLHYELIKNNLTIDPLHFSYDDKDDRSIIRYYNLLKDLDQT